MEKPISKRRKIECLLCKRTFDSDYRSRRNKKYHAQKIKKHQHVPYQQLGSRTNSFQIASSSSSSKGGQYQLAEAKVSCNETNVNSNECEPQKIQAELQPELDAPEAAEPSPGIMHFVTGFRDWKKALVKFSKHEQSGCHVDSSVDYVNFCTKIAIDEQLSDATRQTSMARQKRVEKNRNVMKRLIDITQFLAKQGLAFRGHREDITTETTNKGNFLALAAELLSKYDEILASHLKSQNKIIESIGDKLLQKIVCEIKSAGIYSIAMDCTTDASHADQLSLIITYLNDSYDITERLVNIQRVKDLSAKGLLATLRDILSKNSINLSDAVGQSYDGASVMRGKYNSLKSLIQKESSKKRSDILEEKQKIANISQNRRPQRVSTTRWWSHQRALDNVFFSQSESLYDCFIDTLNDCQSPPQSNETVNDAEALERKLTSFETVLTAHLFKRIFAITDPASSYLQSEKIDFLTAIRLVETAEQQLRQLRDEFGVILTQAKEFCASHELEQQNFAKNAHKREREWLMKTIRLTR
eukprot:gene13076-14419_t